MSFLDAVGRAILERLRDRGVGARAAVSSMKNGLPRLLADQTAQPSTIGSWALLACTSRLTKWKSSRWRASAAIRGAVYSYF
jgi:hypothetical protein